jgi:predicted MFS family arabinose efflux permease
MTPLALLFGLAFLVSVDIRILAPVLPSISVSLGSPPGIVGLAMTSYAFAYGTGQLFYGPLSDRRGRIAVVRAAGLAFSVFTVLSALSASTWQFVVARLLAGAFAGAVIPLTLVYIGDTVEYAKRQVVLGRFSALTSCAVAFSAAIGGMVAYLVSWRVMLIGYGMVALIPVGLMWRLEPVRPQAGATPARTAGQFASLLRDRRAQALYLAVFLEGALLWGAVTYVGAFAAGRHGLDQFAVGLLIALMGVGTMAGGLLLGRIRRILSENGLARCGGALMGIGYLLLVPEWPWPLFAASMLVLGFGFAALHTTLQLRGTELSAASRGTAFALFAFSLFTGIAIGTAALGRLVDLGSYEAVFGMAGLGLVGIGVWAGASGGRRAR